VSVLAPDPVLPVLRHYLSITGSLIDLLVFRSANSEHHSQSAGLLQTPLLSKDITVGYTAVEVDRFFPDGRACFKFDLTFDQQQPSPLLCIRGPMEVVDTVKAS
jgi:hypothetical protein